MIVGMEQIKMHIPIQEALELAEEYVIRPFVGLKGLRNGYNFNRNNPGYWRLLMDANVKNFTKEITGILLKHNFTI